MTGDDNDGIEGQQPLLPEEVDPEIIMLWLRRARRKYRSGVVVIKVTSQGKLVKRTLHINVKNEYIELISSKLFDTAYHLSDILRVEHGVKSSDFEAFRALQRDRMPKDENALVLYLNERTISLVFMTAADRMDAQMLIMMEKALLEEGYGSVSADSIVDEDSILPVPIE